ncbi:cytoplasm protein [Gigaspora margarita]|uniref:Cytoplasm protein n=1 Tax=Gigaspora margarita TaxID=4874 RepID=A0A8H4EUN9_GIGMA|nr:cytoplasm protein [Gigaspora margarita]
MRFSRSYPHSALPLYKEFSKPTLTYRSSRQILIIGLAYIILILILINLFHFLPYHKSKYSSIKNLDYSFIPPNPSHSDLQDLVIVAGHAIFLGNGLEKVEQDDNWILEDFQKGGHVRTFLNHIKKGIELAQQNTKALLVFSGGQTRPAAGPMSEAQSYYTLAQKFNLFSAEENSHLIIDRMTTEEYARDSYENLLFSICRFREVTGHYPRNITVIGFEFKRKRFLDIHRAAIKFPLDRFTYIGIDSTGVRSNTVKIDNALEPFRHDIYACHSGILRNKKLARNPFRRRHPYYLSCPSLSDLISYCPQNPTSIFPNKLPWETS